jgi:hypothetical protein
MHVLDQQVGGEQEIFAAAARAVDGAVVADAQHQGGSGRGAGAHRPMRRTKSTR